ncbi:MAG: YncE family protein [Gammaproteobacteria bacterium]|nr:MAG: YncE family protein [Gammaproteobacteria bacterium]
MQHPQLSWAALVAAGALQVGGAQPAAPPAASSYRMIAQYPIGGNDAGYDYLRVEASTRRVFIAHANRVEVLNVDTGQKLGEITGMHGVHGIELIPELGKGYTSNGLDRTVTVFDRNTLRVLKLIRYTGVKPDAIQYDPDSRRLFVVNGGASGDVTIIDPSNDAIVDTLDLGGAKLEQIGFDGRGRAFVNDEAKSVMHVFETHSLKSLAKWSLGPCEEPTGMAVDRAHHRVFAACGNEKLAVLDTDDGRVVAAPAIGRDPDGAVFDSNTQRIFTSNKEGTLSVLQELSPDRYETLQTLRTQPGARTLAMDENTGRIFLPTARTAQAPVGGGAAQILPQTFTLLVAGPVLRRKN